MTNPLRPNSHVIPDGDPSKIRGYGPSHSPTFTSLAMDARSDLGSIAFGWVTPNVSRSSMVVKPPETVARHCDQSPLDRMHRANPADITEVHMRAVDRLLQDYEGGKRICDRAIYLSGVHRCQPTASETATARTFDVAWSAMGPGPGNVVVFVAVLELSIKRCAFRIASTEQHTRRLLVQGLNLLVEHYQQRDVLRLPTGERGVACHD
jgi:hypothetical protein